MGGPVRALVVCDMINDFVTGALANPRAEPIIPKIQWLLGGARADRDRWLVAYVNDAHLPEDVELAVWGEHAMAGTPGADVIPEVAAAEGEHELSKRVYSVFHETGLDPLLRYHGVRDVVLVGMLTNICIQHSSADAFYRGYSVTVPEDAVEALTQEEQDSALAYLRRMYAVRTPTAEGVFEVT
jgi:nicotinamidase-related amidase